MEKKIKKVKILSSKTNFEGKWVTVRTDKIIKPDGTRATHEVVGRGNAVVVVAPKDNKYCMVRMYRYAVNGKSWEFPMGTIDKGELSTIAAKRELKEETGLIAEKLKYIDMFWPFPGMSSQKMLVYLASDLTVGKRNLDETESDMECKYFTKKEILKMVKENKIKNGPTLATLSLLEQS